MTDASAANYLASTLLSAASSALGGQLILSFLPTAHGEVCQSAATSLSSSFGSASAGSTSVSPSDVGYNTAASSPQSSSHHSTRLNGGHSPSSSSSSAASSSDALIASSAGGSKMVNVLLKPAKVCPDFKDEMEQSACCESHITQGSFYCCTQAHKAQLQWEMDKEAWRQFIQEHLPGIIIGSLLLVLFFLMLATFLCKRFTFCPLYRPKSLGAGINNAHHRYSFATGRYHSHHRPFLASVCNPLIAAPNTAPYSHQSLQYHQQAAVIHKPPAPYEAPPPYEFIATMAAPPPPLISPPPLRHDSGFDSVGSSSLRLVNNPSHQQRVHDWGYLAENEANNIRQFLIADAATATDATSPGEEEARGTTSATDDISNIIT